ncbi:nucleolar complex-associated protein-domain-containing protein [Diplogelasinospora grovesii]|uniref:Nucleolar complex-associated protein 3 n=1 Tax=Diplogelasinospora grovesii TaxID=303347 RepID=A0AAN6ND16_9PEZI|nr:nucleolar complex-associated protein-domain-containing protein [Diplogelasinospora grovesii]
MSSRPPKRRKLTPPPQSEDGVGNGASDVKIQKQFFKNASTWNLEKAYESRPKKGKKDKKKAAKEGRLPVKTAAGTWAPQDDVASIASDAEWLESEGDGEGQEEEEAPKPVVEEPKIPEREQVRRAQEELAKIATQLNEDPEEHSGAFKALAKIAESRSLAVKKLCLVTQMAVYKDVIPGYRIRPATEEPAGEKLSKDVKRLRTYEQALVSGYHGYIKSLAHHATSPAARGDRPGQSIANIALTCACTLLNAVPHFNFRGDLLRILVRKLSTRKIDADFAKCRQAIETLYQEDEEGRPSMEATSLLTKMMKAKEYRVDESVLNLFLHLRLLSEFHGKASQDKVNRPDAAQPNGKKGQQKKEFRTKKERKLMKEQKAAEKVMAAADATVSHEERDQMQSETLKMVFATYFRVLKQRSPHLMGAVLEGLAKYAHLINQDFFGDLLEALKDLINYSEKDEEEDKGEEEDDDDKINVVRDTSREALLCTVTAFALLAGQDAHNARADLHLDLSFFITNLYRSLLALSVNPDVELGAKSLHASDPDDVNGGKKFKVNVQTTTVLLLRCLHGILLPPWNIRQVPPLRLAAFAKQLMTSSLHMPEKSTQAVLTLLQDVIHTHGRKINALWNTEERKGDGTFNPLSETVEGSNPFTTTVWEGEILRKHYCPKVREGLKQMEKDLASI